jgi:GNAT superfamily N-acetyltransferase
MRMQEILSEMYIEPVLSRDTIRDGWRWAADAREPFGKLGEVSVLTQKDGKHLYFKFVSARKMIGFAYLWRQGHGIHGQVVNTIYLQPDHQNQGLGSAFYKLLLDKGVTIVAGITQTTGGQAIWRKIMAMPGVKVLAMTGYEDDDPPGEIVDASTIDPWGKGNGYVQLIASRN